MPDIVVGVLIMLALSAVLFWCGAGTARRLSRGAWAWLASAAVASIVLFGLVFHGTLFVAQVLPFSNVIVLGNWIPLGAAFLSGMVGGQRFIPPWRQAFFGMILVSLGSFTLLCNFLGTPPPPQLPRWRNGVCLQSTPASCAPCSAVTLLRARGIESNEREMMELCLTNEEGTSSLGLYRGLKLKTRNTPWAIEVVRCNVDELRQADWWPVLLHVRLENTPVFGARQTGLGWGALAGGHHTVVLFGFTEDGRVEIGDPSDDAYGRTQWTVDELKQRWCGEGLRLVQRDPRVD